MYVDLIVTFQQTFCKVICKLLQPLSSPLPHLGHYRDLSLLAHQDVKTYCYLGYVKVFTTGKAAFKRS